MGSLGLMLAILQVLLQVLQAWEYSMPVAGPGTGGPKKGSGSHGNVDLHPVLIVAIVLAVLAAAVVVIAFWPHLKEMVCGCHREKVPVGRCRVHWRCVSGAICQRMFQAKS